MAMMRTQNSTNAISVLLSLSPAHLILILMLLITSLCLQSCSDDVSQTEGEQDVTGDFADTTLPDTNTDTTLLDTNTDTTLPDTGGDTTIGDTTVDTTFDTNLPVSCGYGDIIGRVCSPNGSEWLFGVEVSIETSNCEGQITTIQSFTDNNGFYHLSNIPNGNHTITIETGSFTTEVRNVPVEVNSTTDLTGQTTKTCLDRRAAKIAVLTGVFDNFESLLENLGIAHSLYEGDSADLNPNPIRDGQALISAQDTTELLSYDILIINSGEWYRLFGDPLRSLEVTQMLDNIQLFVESGGSLYVSDWAYFWVETAYPERIDFYGNDDIEGEARAGSANNNVTAEVISDDFLNALQRETNISLNFNWPAWTIAESANSSTTTIHVQATDIALDNGEYLSNVPLVISFQPTPTSGSIFFTSFHADANEGTMKEILKFLVFQL